MRCAHSLLSMTLAVILLGAAHFARAEAATPAPSDTGEPKSVVIPDAVTTEATEDPIWTRWDAEQLALADDGEAIWVGGGQGLLRWDKATATARRYATPEGLPSRRILAVAVDSAGNRWFGGDGGLSRLDAAGNWHHATPANSGIYSDTVAGIAVAADGTLWLSYLAPQNSVSQRTPGGTWQHFVDRAAAVAAGYATISTTVAPNPLWTVAGGEVWVGYQVFDGTAWTDRTPEPPRAAPQQVVAAPDGDVWALDDDTTLWRWDGSTWHERTISFNWGGAVTAIAVDAGSRLWLGLRSRDYGNTPYSGEQPAVEVLDGAAGPEVIPGSVPVAALLTDGNDIWGIGPGWLRAPGGAVHHFGDTVANPVAHAVLDASGATWLHSGLGMQIVDDRGTALLADDIWGLQKQPYPYVVTALERAPGGDVWMAYLAETRFGPYLPGAPIGRYHQGTWYGYSLPNATDVTRINDIFALDDRHIWLTLTHYNDGAVTGRVLGFDDGGTPTDPADDRWTEYPAASRSDGGAVAVDSNGRLWYGSDEGLARWSGTAWQTIWTAGTVCDLTPASGGYLFALVAPLQVCVSSNGTALMVAPDDRVTPASVGDMVAAQLPLVRTALRANRLWSVAAGGVTWYLARSGAARATADQLFRRDDNGLHSYDLPVDSLLNGATWMEAGAGGHVWVIAAQALWRFSARPGLAVTPAPQHWLVTPGGSRAGEIIAAGREGYATPVQLGVYNLPPGIATSWTTAVVTPTTSLSLTVTAAGDTGEGDYPFTLLAKSGTISYTVAMTAVVTNEIRLQHLPEIHR